MCIRKVAKNKAFLLFLLLLSAVLFASYTQNVDNKVVIINYTQYYVDIYILWWKTFISNYI